MKGGSTARNDKDINEKLLEDYNDVFADIMNVFLFDGDQLVKPDDLETALPVSSYKADGKIHEQERDSSKYWKKEGVFVSLIGLENQSDVDRYMPFRIIGYDGAGYRAQISKIYHPGFPVITIPLYFGLHHWNDSLSLKDHLIIPERLQKEVNDYRIHVREIAFLTDAQIHLFRSDFRYVADFFAKIRIDPTYQGTDAEIKHLDEVMGLIAAMNRKGYGGNVREKVRKGELRTMKSIFAEAENKGRTLGIVEGKTNGVRLQQLKTAAAMIADGFTDEKIMRYTSMTKKDVEEERKKLILQ